MKYKSLVLGAAFTIVLTTAMSPIFANVKQGKFGVDFQLQTLSVGYAAAAPTISPSVGLWYHVFDFMAIDAGFGFYSYSLQQTATGVLGCTSTASNCTNTSSSLGWLANIDVPFYVLQKGILNLYLAPGISYTSYSGDSTYSNPNTGQTYKTDNGRTSTWGFGAYVGVQLPILDQLHLFGKTGLEYGITRNTIDTNYLGTRIASVRYSIGAIFYFN